jgi:uncharacterized heparinase superfamily protein
MTMNDQGMSYSHTSPASSVLPGNRVPDLGRAMLGRARDAVFARTYASWLYGQTLRGPMPDHMILYPEDLRPGRIEAADAMFQGRWFLPGGQVRLEPNGSPFNAGAPSETWEEELHGFSWLRHFSTAGGEAARDFAQKLVANWIATSGTWHRAGWQPHVIGRRLTSWVANGALIIDGSDLIYRSGLLRSMARQARHLARVASMAPAGEPRMTAAMGLTFSGLCLSEGRKRLVKGLRLLCGELDRQILPDGGHISRNPAAQLSILLDLISLRDAMTARRIEVPKPIRDAIDRMMPMLRFFRHGDGRLALFNGANEGPDGAIDAALLRDDTKGRPFGLAPHSGYQRMAAGTTLLIADTGTPPPGVHSHLAHAGCLSFEMSSGKSRVIVNCGATRILGEDWEAASRATAAHSTLVVSDTSSARVLRNPLSRALLGPRILEGPTQVESAREENENGTWIKASHNGYGDLFGLIHGRQLFMSPSGEDLRGEDELRAVAPRRSFPWQRRFWRRPAESLPFSLSFHLHPDARASLAHDGSHVLIRLAKGEGWQFRLKSSGETELRIEESVYLGSGDSTRRGERIVASGHVFRGEAKLNWALKKVTSRSAAAKPGSNEIPELPDLDMV